jgi:transporter family-2 protein
MDNLEGTRRMQTLFVAIIFGLAGGAAAALQSPLTSLMSQRVGTMASVFVVHLGGALLAGMVLLALGGERLYAWRSVPWYCLAAGALGLVVLPAVSYAIPRIGTVATITLIIAGQLAVRVIVDQFGLLGTSVRPLDLPRLLGIAVLALGAWLILR